jgi:tetratricopeptide (TPR) repeat protein
MSKRRDDNRRPKNAKADPKSKTGEMSHESGNRPLVINKRPVLILAIVVFAAAIFTWLLVGRGTRVVREPVSSGTATVTRAHGSVTFSRDVAPIIFSHCAECHRPDEAAPFSLLTYEQVKKRARLIADVTARRLMPPWPPEPGYGDFVDERRLIADELAIIQQWVAQGAVEGNPADLPPAPKWTDEWQLGQPNLIVKMPQPYELSAEGKDVYRNFVTPIPTTVTRFVKAVQLVPGNAKVVHHAFIDVDETRQSRRKAEKENPPGFGGMELPDSAVMPAGQFLGWQPGKSLYRVPDGLAWVLKTNTDLVLQMHMHPSGKPELVQPAIGFYFTDQAPTNLPFRLRLLNYQLDIPPGADNYVAEQSYKMPVDLELLRVNPHAHYLGKDLQGYAVLPNGERKWLLRIKDWDFNWQGDYQYARPLDLPKGTTLVMRFTYDNSTNNVRNPNHLPRRVRHGINTTDEMAALGFQVLTRSRHDREVLANDYQLHLTQILVDYFRFRLRNDPNDSESHTRLASFLFFQQKPAEGWEHLRSAIQLNPTNALAHYEVGYRFLLDGKIQEAWDEFQTVIRLNPEDSQAYGNLGFICLQRGWWPEAKRFLESALRLNPDDDVARRNLGLAIAAQAAQKP